MNSPDRSDWGRTSGHFVAPRNDGRVIITSRAQPDWEGDPLDVHTQPNLESVGIPNQWPNPEEARRTVIAAIRAEERRDLGRAVLHAGSGFLAAVLVLTFAGGILLSRNHGGSSAGRATGNVPALTADPTHTANVNPTATTSSTVSPGPTQTPKPKPTQTPKPQPPQPPTVIPVTPTPSTGPQQAETITTTPTYTGPGTGKTQVPAPTNVTFSFKCQTGGYAFTESPYDGGGPWLPETDLNFGGPNLLPGCGTANAASQAAVLALVATHFPPVWRPDL